MPNELAAQVRILQAAEARLSSLPGTGAELAAVRSQLSALQQLPGLQQARGQGVPALEGPGLPPTNAPLPSVTTVGVGEILDTPDVLTLTVGVSVQRPTASGAMDAANAGASRVIQALESHGVASRDIQTAFVGFGRDYQGKFDSSNQVTAKLRDIPHAGDAIGAAADAGGADAQGWGVSFDLQDNARQLAAARAAAIADAHAQAADFARLTGHTLGAARTVSEGYSSAPGPQQCCVGGSGASGTAGGPAVAQSFAVPIQPGQQTVTVTATVVYDLN